MANKVDIGNVVTPAKEIPRSLNLTWSTEYK